MRFNRVYGTDGTSECQQLQNTTLTRDGNSQCRFYVAHFSLRIFLFISHIIFSFVIYKDNSHFRIKLIKTETAITVKVISWFKKYAYFLFHWLLCCTGQNKANHYMLIFTHFHYNKKVHVVSKNFERTMWYSETWQPLLQQQSGPQCTNYHK